MAKKAIRPARAAKTAKPAASPDTRCDRGGNEILPVVVRLRQSDPVEFLVQLCLAPMQVQVFLGPDRIAEATGQDEVRLRLPALAVGQHSQFWSHLTQSPTWKTLAEVRVNGVVMFRRRKASDGKNPVNSGFLILDVQS